MGVEDKDQASEEENVPVEKTAPEGHAPSRLYERRWAVVNFETCLAASLTYDEAVRELEKYAAENISGLCIITDEAARRIGKKKQ